MTILGHGIDMVENDRIARSISEFGEGFVNRVFCAMEIEYCQRMREPAPHFAARWAAKEAVAKAFGTGIGASISFLDIEVRRKASGEPFVQLHGAGIELAARRSVTGVMLSLSHSRDYSIASVILVGE